MYCNYFGFSEKPFDITPDPRFLFLTPDHQETLASIVYGIRERRGFITIIGEVGTGKTTLLNAAMDRMDENTRVAFIFNTDVTFDQLLNMALYEWGLTKNIEKLSKGEAIQRLNRFAIEQLSKGGNVVLIVDEAQNLDNRVMENLRLLSNLETRKHKLIQIVLSGQPELYLKLSGHELRQLAQRISLKRYVSPLDEKYTYAYLKHRLKKVQNTDASPFTAEAQQLIWKYSKGVPRKINILCDNAFLIAYGMNVKKINKDVVWESIQDLTWDCSLDKKGSLDESASLEISSPKNTSSTWVESKPPRRSFKMPAAMVIAGIMVLFVSFFLNTKDFHFAKLTNFLNGIKNVAMEKVHPEQEKEQATVSKTGMPAQAAVVPKVVYQKISKKNVEPETQDKELEISTLTLSNYHLVKEKSPDFIVQHNGKENMWQIKTLDENNESKSLNIKEEKQDLSVPETQVDDNEKSKTAKPVKENKIIRDIVVKEGDTLGNIIIKIYGAYSDLRLFKVQKENPDIMNPDLILPGQIIKLPEE